MAAQRGWSIEEIANKLLEVSAKAQERVRLRDEVSTVAQRKRLRAALQPHQHWHIDVSYINVSGTFYYLCSILDGYSRAIVHWDLRESMTEAGIEVILQRAREKYPEAKPRIISENGPQFIAM